MKLKNTLESCKKFLLLTGGDDGIAPNVAPPHATNPFYTIKKETDQ
ncbi:hypothetical protein [Portibacter marinus]|nr:hypothetical protein [Portibacter marinus]